MVLQAMGLAKVSVFSQNFTGHAVSFFSSNVRLAVLVSFFTSGLFKDLGFFLVFFRTVKKVLMSSFAQTEIVIRSLPVAQTPTPALDLQPGANLSTRAQ